MSEVNLSLLYDDRGFCRLCGWERGDHQEDCPGIILDGLRYQVSYRGSYCARGCCGGTQGEGEGATLMEAVRDAAGSLTDCVSYRAEARLVYELSEDATFLVREEMKRMADAKKAAAAAEEARASLRSNTEAFTRAVQALESEKGDLPIPEVPATDGDRYWYPPHHTWTSCSKTTGRIPGTRLLSRGGDLCPLSHRRPPSPEEGNGPCIRSTRP